MYIKINIFRKVKINNLGWRGVPIQDHERLNFRRLLGGENIWTSSSKGLQTVTKILTQKLRISTHVYVGSYTCRRWLNKQTKNLRPTKPDIFEDYKNNAALLASSE